MLTRRLALVSLFLFAVNVHAELRATRPTTAPAVAPAASEAGIDVYFSPKVDCTDAIVAEIAAAKTSLDVQAYSVTSPPITKAVKEAHERGVRLRVILDKSQRTQRYNSAT